MGVGAEQSIHEADLESDEQPEGDADYAGRQSQTAIEAGEAFAGVGKGRAQDHRDQHHARDGPQPEHQQVSNRPPGRANRSQHQQSDRCRPRQSMHNAHCQRTQQLIDSHACE
jgi:hypothetical protein